MNQANYNQRNQNQYRNNQQQSSNQYQGGQRPNNYQNRNRMQQQNQQSNQLSPDQVRSLYKRDTVTNIIKQAETDFKRIAKASGIDIKYCEEAIYASQLIEANFINSGGSDYSLMNATPESVIKSLVLVATSGLTLNPQYGLAYLVPRLNRKINAIECHLEPSYKGLRRLGIDSGAITSAVAELVYTEDNFKFVDRFSKPIHEFDPFDTSNRGNIRGGYCLAQRPHGGIICTPVSLDMLNKLRSMSKGSIYNDWEESMYKKSIIRQGFNDWPIGSSSAMWNQMSSLQNYMREIDTTQTANEQAYIEDNGQNVNGQLPALN